MEQKHLVQAKTWWLYPRGIKRTAHFQLGWEPSFCCRTWGPWAPVNIVISSRKVREGWYSPCCSSAASLPVFSAATLLPSLLGLPFPVPQGDEASVTMCFMLELGLLLWHGALGMWQELEPLRVLCLNWRYQSQSYCCYHMPWADFHLGFAVSDTCALLEWYNWN